MTISGAGTDLHKVYGRRRHPGRRRLLTEAFRVMAESPLASARPARAVRAIADWPAQPGGGMVGDSSWTSTLPRVSALPEVERSSSETAALIASCARMGGNPGRRGRYLVEALGNFGRGWESSSSHR